jgi:DNA-binding MarR family transcriptional regulator
MNQEKSEYREEKNSTPEDERADQVRNILQNLRMVFRSIQSHSRWVEKQCGVSGAQLWAMWELFASPGLRVSDLSAKLSIHQSTASNMLDKLENKGLVKRERRGPDQRVVRLFLTGEGTHLLADAPRPAQGALTHALHQLSDNTLDQLDSGLGRLIQAMVFTENDAGLEPIIGVEQANPEYHK